MHGSPETWQLTSKPCQGRACLHIDKETPKQGGPSKADRTRTSTSPGPLLPKRPPGSYMLGVAKEVPKMHKCPNMCIQPTHEQASSYNKVKRFIGN